MWIVFSLITSFLETSKDTLSKISSVKTNEFVSAFALQLFAAIVLLPFVLITGIPSLTQSYWLTILISCVGIPAWSLLYMRAIKLSPLSLSIPLLAFNPVFTAFFAIFFEKRFPDTVGWMAIIAITIGLYLLRFNHTHTKTSLLEPLLSLRREPGSLAMLTVALIWSVGTYVNKIGIQGSSPIFFAFSITGVGAFVLFLIALFKGAFHPKVSRTTWLLLLPIGILNGLSELALMYALTTGFVPYVVAIKRINILWSSLIGVFFYKESLSRVKLIGLLLMLLGVISLLLF